MNETILFIKWRNPIDLLNQCRKNRNRLLLLINASMSSRSCSRICSYVVSSCFPLCSFALRKVFASFDCRPLKSMSLSENSFNGAGVTGFWDELLLVVFNVCSSDMVCLDPMFGIFFSASIVRRFLVSVRGGFIPVHWTRKFKAINAINHNIWFMVEMDTFASLKYLITVHHAGFN